MNLKQLKYVIVLAEQGSFSRAAEELNISQPSLSQYVRKIEQELDIELFDRSGSVIRLTDAGRAYIEAGRKIIDIEHQLLGQFSDLKNNETGSIIIGASPHRSMCILPPVVAAFRKKYPGIQVIIDERVGQELLDKAERGEYDICLTTAPVDTHIFECEHILADECILAVPSGSELDLCLHATSKKMAGRRFPAIDIKEIDHSDFITLAEPQLMQRILYDLCADYGISVNKTVVCTSLAATYSLVCEGIASALLTSSIVKNGNDNVQCYSIRQDIPHREVVVVYRKGQRLSEAAKEMIALLKTVL